MFNYVISTSKCAEEIPSESPEHPSNKVELLRAERGT